MAKITRSGWGLIVSGVAVIALVVVLLASGLTRFYRGDGSSSAEPSTGPTPSAVAEPPSTAPVPSATQQSNSGSTSAGPSPSATPSSAPPSDPAASAAQQALDSMTLPQKVGQVLMVSSSVGGPDANTVAALTTYHVGNVFLKGRSRAGAAAAVAVVAQIKAQVSAQSTAGVQQFVATDQEGGLVQVLNGPGFSPIPSALNQGTLAPATLRADAQLWGSQLASAGVNVNLAPVLDTVPGPDFAPSNIPIGRYQREYGYTPEAVSSHGVAVARGMAAAGIATAVKHFPGLGRVTANTDTNVNVTDGVTTRHDAYLIPFRDAVNAGVRWVMVGNAIYAGIDPGRPAPFSPIIINGMLRGDLGFDGIIISDDICDAVQLSPFLPEDRAANFIAAGGTMALCTDQALLPRLYQGVIARATAEPAFAVKVDAAVLKVLEAKAKVNLLGR